MADAEWLKKEIDTIDTNDKIEVQEIEEFLKSEENIKELWDAINENCSPELLEEFESIIWDLCDTIIAKDNDITLHQFKILWFYTDTFKEASTKYKALKKKWREKTTISAIFMHGLQKKNMLIWNCKWRYMDTLLFPAI